MSDPKKDLLDWFHSHDDKEVFDLGDGLFLEHGGVGLFLRDEKGRWGLDITFDQAEKIGMCSVGLTDASKDEE